MTSMQNCPVLKKVWDVIWKENSWDGRMWFILGCFFIGGLIIYGIRGLLE